MTNDERDDLIDKSYILSKVIRAFAEGKEIWLGNCQIETPIFNLNISEEYEIRMPKRELKEYWAVTFIYEDRKPLIYFTESFANQAKKELSDTFEVIHVKEVE